MDDSRCHSSAVESLANRHWFKVEDIINSQSIGQIRMSRNRHGIKHSSNRSVGGKRLCGHVNIFLYLKNVKMRHALRTDKEYCFFGHQPGVLSRADPHQLSFGYLYQECMISCA